MENCLVYYYDFSLPVWIFLEAWCLCVQVFKGFFLRPTFAVKELIQTPIERQCKKIHTMQEKEERGLLVVFNHSSQVAKTVQHCVKRINLRLLYTRCELSGSSDQSAPPPLPLPPPRCAEEGGIKTYFSYAVLNRRYKVG